MSTAVSTPAPFPGTDSEDSAQVTARRARRRRAELVWLGRIVLPIVVLGGWQLFTSVGIVDKFFFGQPTGIWHSLVELFTKGTAFGSVWLNIWVTIKEAIYGFFLGTFTGIILGLLLGQNRLLSDIASPYIKALNSIPRIILGAIFTVAFGLGTFPKALLAAVLVFFIVFFNAFQGVREVDPNLVANVKILGASPFQVARHVTIPSALTWIIASLHTAFGFAIIGALVAEVLGAQHGMGLVITQAQGTFDNNTVFAAMAIMSVVTLIAEYLLSLLEKRVLAWRPPSRAEAQAI
ncbi:MAG TPA: ABC transporter permease [Segeticoccus sp.]|uniref:ABC transporter permease n=1 Tax=Segeticoccus sp. TaxID=2706531 RepID=UPI002D7E57C5|nr:ABC transporter permease [Segeticoccus sp.]HET8601278.1 ABC transporter permease [Segeticoccus sp.]